MSTAEPRYPYVVVDVPPEEADEMGSTLFELGALGVEERDETTLIKGKVGAVTLVASFGSHEEASEAVDALEPRFSPRIEEVVGDAWRDEWKKHFRPFDLCEGIVVRPPWEAHEEARAGWQVLELEPGRAFGTGLHETTSLVARALQDHTAELAGATVLDVGCGSGILALVALLLGAKAARAIDNDPVAIEVTKENAERNGKAAAIDADITDVTVLPGTFPVVLANIEARVLIPLSDAIRARTAPGGLLVLSGILAPQKEEVLAAYADMTVEAAPQKGEWIALVLRKAA
jgi:ribosomal protein L11 methyltransferase